MAAPNHARMKDVTHCASGHEFDEENTVWRKRHKTGEPMRACKKCAVRRNREYRQRKAAEREAMNDLIVQLALEVQTEMEQP